MAQPYRLNEPGGVEIVATGQIINPGDPEWQAYVDWLMQQPAPTVPGGPVPAGTGLLPYVAPVMTLAQQRAEAFARLRSIYSERVHTGTVVSLGHTWTVTWPFVVALNLARALMPPVPPGFALPNSVGASVPLNQPDCTTLASDVMARIILATNNFSALVTAINASATPLTVDLTVGWPP